ncbi:MAG: hypothetical protein IJU18_06095 [Oscillospiraceae bacterium]|nr:hypothetical protein [Oscillospiraceae bacterium]
MHPQFQRLNARFFLRAFVYTGSIGDFRYRFAHDDRETLHAAVYTKLCYEKADDVQNRDFPWTEEGAAQLRQWLQESYDRFCAEGKL